MYWLNVYEIPEGARTGKGKAIVNMIKIEPGEKIRAMLTVSPEELNETNKFIVMASRRGFVKKTELALFKNLRRTGLRALVIEDDDDLIGAAISENGNEILLSTKLGMACRFDQNDERIRPMGRTARGVTGMRFKIEDDSIVSMEIIREIVGDEVVEDENGEEVEVEVDVDAEVEESALGVGPEILVVTTGGMGKRSYISSYRKTNRGAKGVANIRLRDGEEVLSVVQIQDHDEILLNTERGQLVRIPANEIRSVGRNSRGVKIMNLNDGDKLTGVARLVEVEAAERPAISTEGDIVAAGVPVGDMDTEEYIDEETTVTTEE